MTDHGAQVNDDLPGAVRAEFPVTSSRAYLFTGGIGPASRATAAAVGDWIGRWTTDPAGIWDGLFAEWEGVRARLARLLGTKADSIAVVDGTSRASNLAVALLPARRRGNVVIDATTYKSSLFPWLVPERRWVEVRRAASGAGGLAASLDDFDALVDDETVAISITHVDPRTGFRHPLRPIADLAHARGAVLIVDIAQSAGTVPVDLADDGVDLAAGTAMKWLLGPPGIGFLYVSEALLAAGDPPQVGYLGAHLDPSDQSKLILRPGARRHEVGMANLLGMPGFRAGLDLILGIGVQAIHGHSERLVSRLLDGLSALCLLSTTPTDPSRRAALVTIPAEHPEDLGAFIRERGVDVWTHRAPAFVRADVALFNNAGDVDRLLEGLRAYLQLRGPGAIQTAVPGP